MFTKDEFDMLSLRCEPQKLILRFEEPIRKQKERTNRFYIAEMSSLFL